MRILVLGGTYFLGKAFAEIACKEHEITLLNRGNRNPVFACPEHIRQITMDRHRLMPGSLAQEKYDVVVDFCAYEKGDILQVIDAIAQKDVQYIFISTCDVYQKGTGKPLDENAAFETRDYGGAAGAYILGKAALEKELLKAAADRSIRYNSVRPSFIYGPDNYANRESMFFHWIEQAGQVLYPKDAAGSFQMVYVKDAAKVILELCGNTACYNKSFNICGRETVTYESFCEALAYAAQREFEKVEISVEEILKRQIPLPFPLTEEESEHYISKNAELLSVSYTGLKEGLRLTYLYYEQLVQRQ